MGNKAVNIIISIVLLFSSTLCWADKAYKSKRWRLKYQGEMPRTIAITYPDGTKKTYWYIKYKIINNHDRDIPWMVNLRIIIDKPREGVPESKLPGMFFNAEITANRDKEEYIKNLMTYYDVDLPIAKKEIFEKLGLHPRLSKNEKAIVACLDNKKAKTIMEIMSQAGISYEQAQQALTRLVVNNLVISQEVERNPVFVKGSLQYATFWINDEKLANKVNEVQAKVGDVIAGWEVLDFDRNRVVMKKNDIVTSFSRGSTLEYLYLKTDKSFVEEDVRYVSGMAAKGTYKGRMYGSGSKKGQRYAFENAMIPKKSVRHGLAIFQNISPEMDFMAVVVTGLVDPIVRRDGLIYIENEVYMCGYKRPGDAYYSNSTPLTPLYQKWMVISTRPVKGRGKARPKKSETELGMSEDSDEPGLAKTPAAEEKKSPAKEGFSEGFGEEGGEFGFGEEGEEVKEKKTPPASTDFLNKPYVAIAKKFLMANSKEEMLPLCTKSLQRIFASAAQAKPTLQIKRVVSASDSGNSAKVVVEAAGKQGKGTVFLIKESGAWKVDDMGVPTPKGEMRIRMLFMMMQRALKKMGKHK